jgi:hypothetical protein
MIPALTGQKFSTWPGVPILGFQGSALDQGLRLGFAKHYLEQGLYKYPFLRSGFPIYVFIVVYMVSYLLQRKMTHIM